MKVTIFVIACFSHFAAVALAETSSADCSRIVSMAPSITETAFALGLGDRVVGVSKYSDYPPEAKTRPLIGGLLDLNFEAIVALKPTLVLGLTEFSDKIPLLRALHIPVVAFEHRSIKGVLSSINELGALCNRREAAERLLAEIGQRTQSLRTKVRGRPLVRTMVVVGESSGDGTLRSLYLSGSDGFYNDILELAGGINAVQAMTLGISGVSAEGVISLHPDAIIEITMSHGGVSDEIDLVRRTWNSVPGVPAVRNGRILVTSKDYSSVPGPRFIQVADDFARFLHPEAF